MEKKNQELVIVIGWGEAGMMITDYEHHEQKLWHENLNPLNNGIIFLKQMSHIISI